MQITIKRVGRRTGTEGIEIATCPALRHRHSRDGWLRDGCRCPTTAANYEHRRQKARQWQSARTRGVGRTEAFQDASGRLRDPAGGFLPVAAEIDDCPARRHTGHNRADAYNRYGCRCPSTVKAYEKAKEDRRLASREYRARKKARLAADPNLAKFNLQQADHRDAEALALGMAFKVRLPMATRALAVWMMIKANPYVTDREIAWHLHRCGQSPRDGSPVTMRSVARIVRALRMKAAKKGEPLMRMHDTIDRGQRAA